MSRQSTAVKADPKTDLLIEHVLGEVGYIQDIEACAVLQQSQSLIYHSDKGVLTQHLQQSCNAICYCVCMHNLGCVEHKLNRALSLETT